MPTLAKIARMARAPGPLAFLGSSLLGIWDAERADLITQSSNLVASWRDVVGGYTVAQAIGASKPTYSATAFNNRPAVCLDGVDDELTLTGVPASFPTGATAGEVWVLADQLAPAVSDTNTRVSVSYGDASTVARHARRSGASSVSRASALNGDGAVGAAVNLASPPSYFGRCVHRTIFNPTSFMTELDGTASTSQACVQATATTRFRIGATPAGTAAQFGWLNVSAVLVVAPLSAGQSARLYSYLNARK